MSNVPQWIVASLGKEVELAEGFMAGWENYPVGHVCRLISIQAGSPPYLTIAPDANDISYEENVAFSDIRPHRH